MASPTEVDDAREFLSSHPPFAQMDADDVEFVARRVELLRFSRGQSIVGPDSGQPGAAYIVGEGIVEALAAFDAATGESDGESDSGTRRLGAGDMFPVAALLAAQPASSEYRAADATRCWALAKADFDELTRRSPVFLGYCRRQLGALFELSQRALQASYALRTAQRREMDATLESMLRRAPVTCAPGDPLRAVLAAMERESVGAMIVVDPSRCEGGVAGIFTRQDVIGRIVLAQVSLETPVSAVMSSPVISLDADASVADAMLLMAQRNIRHVPVVRRGALAGIVTERDLFVLQRRGLRQIGDAIRAARDVSALRVAADDIREWSYSLVAQGVGAGFVTRLISRMNDSLTSSLIRMVASEHAIDVDRLCWLAMGSEGREEQTIATDQDNGMIVSPDCESSRDALLGFALAVNEALDRCGYPLCRGGIMASNPKWCADLDGWKALFDEWIDRGDPQSLLNSSIFFDFRALTGATALARSLREHVSARAKANPRFLKQMSDNALLNSPPGSWTGGLLGQLFRAGQAEVDLKLGGAVPFVDGARLLALANGIEHTATTDRLIALAESGAIPAAEARNWNDAFQFIQSLRLRVQHRHRGLAENPNLLDTRTLSQLDRRILKDAFGQARLLQRRLELDYPG